MLKWVFAFSLPILLIVLLVFEKRRQRATAARAQHIARLVEEERFEELEDELDEELRMDEESTAQTLKAFVRGRPTRYWTAFGIVEFLEGIVSIVLLGALLFMVFQSALVDRVVQIILGATAGVILLIVLIHRATARRKRRRAATAPAERRIY